MAAAAPAAPAAPAAAPRRPGNSKLKAELENVREAANKKAAALRANIAALDKRRIVDGVEAVAGGVLGGAIHGAGFSIAYGEGEELMEIPISAPVGIVAMVGGVMANQKDIQAIGTGMAAFGLGRLVEDIVADAF